MNKLSEKVRETIIAGASASIILTTFLTEREGDKLHAYQDGRGNWTICKGLTRGVHPGMTLTKAQCADRNKEEVERAMAIVEHYIRRDIN